MIFLVGAGGGNSFGKGKNSLNDTDKKVPSEENKENKEFDEEVHFDPDDPGHPPVFVRAAGTTTFPKLLDKLENVANTPPSNTISVIPTTSTTTTLTTPAATCQDQVLEKLTSLIQKDSEGVLGMMFELTAMRLAKRALQDQDKNEEPATTMEEMVTHNIAVLKAKLKDTLTSENIQIQIQVRAAYQQFGLQKDLDKINKSITDLDLDPIDFRLNNPEKGVCYYDPGLSGRLRNDESSAFIMAVVIGESGTFNSTVDEPSRLTDIDAATVWAVERIRKAAEVKNEKEYKIGKANGNLMNVSTRVAFYLGTIDDGRNIKTADKMEILIKEQIKKLKTSLERIAGELKSDGLNQCSKEAKLTDCVVCNGSKAKTVQSYIDSNFEVIQRGLLKNIAGDTANLDSKIDRFTIKDLKGEIGNTVFDFSNYAKPSEKKKSELNAKPNRKHDENSTCKKYRKRKKGKNKKNEKE